MRLEGVVSKNSMDKTVVVEVHRKLPHPMYNRVISLKKKYYAHTEDKVEPGTSVIIEETKPISKTKRWKVVEILNN